eukprot:m.218063 g.218063  ORF g.218063 m.218063 type:complete len:69 (+) comp55683_c0_seq1:42-248(+)
MASCKWDSALFDVLPEAIARHLQRPLHVLSVGDSEIWTQVVSCGVDAEPVLLICSTAEIGFNHYDAIV